MPIIKTPLRPDSLQALAIAAGVWAATVPVFMAPTLAAPKPAPTWAWLATVAVALFGMVLTPLLMWVAEAVERWPRRHLRLGLIVAAVIVAAIVHAAFDAASHQVLMTLFQPGAKGTMFVGEDGRLTPAPLHYYVLMNFITLVWVHAGVTALIALSRFNWRIRRQEVAMAEARAAAGQAKLATLRLQLSPHFLFNTLNAISGLVLTGRNAEAESMLARLSEFLRASLGPGEAEQVALASELTAVGAYLEIESLRFDGQLDVQIRCDEGLQDALVPTFLLQPLAEQAVGYAVAPPRRRVRIGIAASLAAPGTVALTLQASTDGAGPASPPDLALAEVRSRLASVYGDAAAIDGTSDADGFSIRARLPLLLDHGGGAG
jgi:two-component system LytT family sensor kinase